MPLMSSAPLLDHKTLDQINHPTGALEHRFLGGIITAFVAELPPLLNAMGEAYERGDGGLVLQAAEQISARASLVGASRLAANATDIGRKARSGAFIDPADLRCLEDTFVSTVGLLSQPLPI